MRILMMAPYIGEVYGGIPKVVNELVETLAQRKILVDLITTDANDSQTLDVSLNTWIERNNYRVRYFPSWFRNDLILSNSLLQWFWKYGSDYDLLHSHTLFSPLNGLIHHICQWQRLPYMMSPHGMLEPWALAYKAWKKKSYYRLVEHRALSRASAIHALTSREVKQIHDLGFKSPVLLPNGIHPQQFRQLASPQLLFSSFPHLEGKSLILFLGRIDPKKGLDLLARAYAQVVSMFPNAHLVIAGPDNINFLPTAKSYFKQTGCGDQITFTGMLSGEIKFSALAAAQIYVAPSYSEGFSMSILEGMASAIPCVFTTGCNFPEAAQANVAYEVETKADEIASALIKCLQNPEQAESMGRRAQKFIFEHYSWDNVVEQLIGTYKSILKHPDD